MAAQTQNLFRRLAGVQVSELAFKLTGALPANSPTEIKTEIKVSPGKVGDQPSLVVTARLKATSGKLNETDGAPIFSALCEISGAWLTVAEPEKLPRDLIDESAREFALPVLFPMARQHLGDILAKAGITVGQWPWSLDTLQESARPAGAAPAPGVSGVPAKKAAKRHK